MFNQLLIARNKANARTFMYLVLVSGIGLTSCRARTKKACNDLVVEIHRGDSFEVAQSKLKECGFDVSFCRKQSLLYGIRWDRGFVVSTKYFISVKLDTENKVNEVTGGSGLVGP